MSVEGQEPDGLGYELLAPIARGGMATVHFATRTGPAGFSRIFAAKRMHENLAADPEMVSMFLDEARIASRVDHPNVVPVVDVVRREGQVLLVLEYVHGVSLDDLQSRASELMGSFPVPIAVAIAAGILAGLHAAHEAKDELGAPLGIVHRDVSPENVLVNAEGQPRIIDFGIAKAAQRSHVTRYGTLKGKLGYMAPEQRERGEVTRAADIYAAGVILWEMLLGRRLLELRGDERTMRPYEPVPSLSDALATTQGHVSAERRRQILRLEPVLARALARDPAARFSTAKEMLDALVTAAQPVGAHELGVWVRDVAATILADGAAQLAAAQDRARQIARDEAAVVIPPRLSRVSTEHLAHAGSIAPNAPRTRKQQVREITVAILATLVIASLLVFVSGGWHRAPSAPASASRGSALAPPAAPTAIAPFAAATNAAAVAPSQAEPPHTATTVDDSPAPPAHRGDVTHRRAPSARVTPPPPPAPSPAAAATAPAPAPCEVPFYMVGSRKVFKQECL